MASILINSNDLRLLGRWAGVVEAAGHDCRIAPVSTLHGVDAAAIDVALVDLGPRGGADTDALLAAVVASLDTRFVAMTAHPDAQEGLGLLRAGVRGYCNRLATSAVVDAVLTSILGGEVWAGRQVTDHLLALAGAGQPAAPAARPQILEKLTAREAEIAEEVAGGYSNKIIAAERGISERTVKAHLNSIYRKTGIRNRVQLALALSREESTSPRRSSA